MQDLSKEQAETHKVLVQPALEAAATATVNVLQQLIKATTEQVLVTHELPPQLVQECLVCERAPCTAASGAQLHHGPGSMQTLNHLI